MKIKDLVGKMVAVVCSTEDEARKVVGILHTAGFGWVSGADLAKTHWDPEAGGVGFDLLESTVIHWADPTYYRENEYKLITAKEFIDSAWTIKTIPDTEFDIH